MGIGTVTDPQLPEYANNPFIARLPSPMSVREALAALADLPAYAPRPSADTPLIRAATAYSAWPGISIR